MYNWYAGDLLYYDKAACHIEFLNWRKPAGVKVHSNGFLWTFSSGTNNGIKSQTKMSKVDFFVCEFSLICHLVNAFIFDSSELVLVEYFFSALRKTKTAKCRIILYLPCSRPKLLSLFVKTLVMLTYQYQARLHSHSRVFKQKHISVNWRNGALVYLYSCWLVVIYKKQNNGTLYILFSKERNWSDNIKNEMGTHFTGHKFEVKTIYSHWIICNRT